MEDYPDRKFERHEKYLKELQRTKRWCDKIDIEAEREAFFTMVDELNRMRNHYVKRELAKYLDGQIEQGFFVDILKDYWNSMKYRIRKGQKDHLRLCEKIELDAKPIELCIALEEIFASGHSENRSNASPDSVNFSSKRYPLNIGGSKKRKLAEDTNPVEFFFSYYKFGAHKLDIGRIITDILKYLEDRYELDFVKLEKERERRKKQKV